MHANGESASTIANALAVSRATVYRVLANRLLKAIERMLRRSGVGHATRAAQPECSSSVRAWWIWSYAYVTIAAVVIVSPLRASDS
jgi:hypothetical protein